MRIPQIDGLIPTSWMRIIGGAKTFAQRAQWWASFPQFIMISGLFYYQSAEVRGIFPSIWWWMAFIGVVGLLAVVVEYSVVLPSQISFDANQNSQENRNPHYAKTLEVERKLDRLLEQNAIADGGEDDEDE